jgi:hypothetical protein
MIMMDKPDPYIAGQGSFAWTYFMLYEKGIFPCFFLAEAIDPYLGDIIDTHYQFMYFITAIIMDYFLLFLISPRLKQILSKN